MNRHLTNPWHRRPACEDHRRDAAATVRAGLTLIELMVVITIIVILVAGSLPVLIPALEQRRTREAARLVHTACGRAQSQAVANGRPAGVLIQRMKRNGRGSVLIYQAVVPPPYAGDTIDAKVLLTAQSGRGGNVVVTASAVDPNDTFSFAPNMARVGDRMQFDYQGPLYEIVGGAAGTPEPNGPGFVTLPLRLTADIGQGEIPWTEPDRRPVAVAYQVFRQPIKTAAEPAQLPAGTVIDLRQSWEGSGIQATRLGGLMSDSKFPIIVTFSRNGSLDFIYYHDGRTFKGHKPRGAVFLLIGKLDKLGSDANPAGTNVQELTNLWVSIGRQTGLVTTSKMSKGDQGLKFARDSQSTGGL
ncbi:MAG: prepilin-type N-terminal cleavage/methylation domain-containing protein [Planctomycetes bacterium]|nr:prepilin-type N-terminal cleavage/methylation domain-containing protein [Planctomycetota bacterium]